MINKKLFIQLFVIAAFLSSCYTMKSYIPKDVSDLNIALPIKPTNIEIIDRRQIISNEEDIKIPFISIGRGETRTFYPKLNPTYENLITKVINDNTAPSENSELGEFFVYLDNAYKEYEPSRYAEIERVHILLKIHLQTNSKKFTQIVNDTFRFESQDASKKHLEMLFQQSLSNVTAQGRYFLREQYLNSKNK